MIALGCEKTVRHRDYLARRHHKLYTFRMRYPRKGIARTVGVCRTQWGQDQLIKISVSGLTLEFQGLYALPSKGDSEGSRCLSRPMGCEHIDRNQCFRCKNIQYLAFE